MSTPAPASLSWYAHELQQALRLPVEVGNFVARNAVDNPLPSPCSIVGIRPYAAGGQRRLVLNAASPLVARCAALCAPGSAPRERYAAIALGTAMLDTGNWPMLELDSPVPTNRWNRVLNTGPMAYHICPMSPVLVRRKVNGFECWAIDYNRVVGRALRQSKDLKTVEDHVETIGDRLIARDDALALELACVMDLRSSSFSSILSSFSTNVGSSLRADEHRKQMTPFPIPPPSSSANGADSLSMSSFFPWAAFSNNTAPNTTRDDQLPFAIPEDGALLTYSSMLPVLLRAFAFAFRAAQGTAPTPYAPALTQGDVVPPPERLAAAFYELGTEDRLFCLSLWFRIPLIDRTGILQGPLKVALDAPYSRPMVTGAEVEAFKASGLGLEEACMQRARGLWAETEAEGEAMDLQVAWSGGIDSTTALVCLMATAVETEGRWGRLVVILDDESISEYPAFYQRFIAGASPPVREIRGDGQSLGSIAARADRLTVTGELGDQLFGSDKTKMAFMPAVLQNAMTGEEQENHFAKGLDAPWQETVLPSLRDEGLLCGTEQQWEAWIAPQLARSPVPIRSTFDMLWWLNFSCKWRQVTLRVIHEVGPIPASVAGRAVPKGAAPGSVEGVMGGFRHFFDDKQLECWACCPENHAAKYLDRTDWCTYKEPLKQVILHYTQDLDYFTNKTKVGSLFREGETSMFSAASLGILADSAHVLRWGALSLCSRVALERYGRSLCHLLPSRLQNGTAASAIPDGTLHKETWRRGPPHHSPVWDLLVDPWADPPLSPSPFDAAPGFADSDERRSRISNPVTAVTLQGKCAALLPAAAVRGRRVVDLGACLGAMCHYALSAGAREVVAVEAQPALCTRARELLGRYWEEAADEGSGAGREAEGGGGLEGGEARAGRFRVVESGIQEFLAGCGDGEFDVVVAAGVLHCFTDPVRVLLEVLRVARVAVMVESNHPHAVRQGAVPEVGRASSWIRGAGGMLQLTPSARCNLAGQELSLAGLSVVPSRQLVEAVCRAHGMQTTRVWLQTHPTAGEDVLTYCGTRRLNATPMRWLLRCFHKEGERPPMQTLEQQVLAGEGNVVGWTRFGRVDNTFAPQTDAKWSRGGTGKPRDEAAGAKGSEAKTEGGKAHADSDAQHSEPKDEGGSAEGGSGRAAEEEDVGASVRGEWRFDADVARNFDEIARQHIPDYQEVIAMGVQLLAEHFGAGRGGGGEGSLGRVRVMDVGSATGNTLRALLEGGFERVQGLDPSEAMNEAARARLPGGVEIAQGEELPSGEEFDALLANWTVHFVKGEAAREQCIRRMVAGLAEGGLLMLTEKTEQNATVRRMYRQWKRTQGVSEAEIERKERMLDGVLEPLPVQWYERVLRESGLEQVSVVSATHGFVTWVGVKPAAPSAIVYAGVPGCIFHRWRVAAAKEVDYASSSSSVEPEEVAPYAVKAWNQEHGQAVGAAGVSVFGFVLPGSGPAELEVVVREGEAEEEEGRAKFTLQEGMYFVAPGAVRVEGGAGVLVLAEGFRAMLSIGGPIEKEGRLPYIDGCSDSLLLPPPRLGDPCLNLLHFPPGIFQTRHTHPSGRAGVVARGVGTCIWVDPDGRERRDELLPGVAFVIPTGLPHSFETADGEEMDVIAFHPDSDFGPTGDAHPMINRTIVGGVSASFLRDIRTDDIRA